MRAPAEAAALFLQGLLFGALMGIGYDFLRPLRRKRNWPADCVFVLLALWLWLCYSFGICRGDIRFGGTAAIGIGACIWIYTAGKLLRGLFFLFWRGIFHIFSVIFLPFQKIFGVLLVFSKKVFASGKKRGTIE